MRIWAYPVGIILSDRMRLHQMDDWEEERGNGTVARNKTPCGWTISTVVQKNREATHCAIHRC